MRALDKTAKRENRPFTGPICILVGKSAAAGAVDVLELRPSLIQGARCSHG